VSTISHGARAPLLALRTIALLALAASAVHVSAQQLWGGTRGGMTIAEVRKLVPGARSPEFTQHLQDGSALLLVARPVRLANQLFAGWFYFRDGRLARVRLMNRGESAAMTPSRARVAEFLTRQYGVPLASQKLSDQASSSHGETWKEGDAGIGLDLLCFRAVDECSLLLEYRARGVAPTL